MFKDYGAPFIPTGDEFLEQELLSMFSSKITTFLAFVETEFYETASFTFIVLWSVAETPKVSSTLKY